MPSKKLIAAIYVRVSTQDQNHDMQSTELRSYVDRMGWTLVEYSEKMSSVRKRPVLEQLMADARLRKFDVVLVWKLDRFARSLTQLTDHLRMLDTFGIRFICPTQAIDTDKQSPAGKLMMHMLGAFAEFERALIVERVNAGIAQAKRDGKHCGRPQRVFSRDEALRLQAEGLGLREIGKKLGVHFSTVSRALKRVAKG